MKKLIALFLLITTLICVLPSCQNTEDEAKPIKIAYMSGPTGMGMAKLIGDNGGVDGNEKYEFISYGDATLAQADLIAGKIDMACLPTNAAAALYNKSGNVQVLALNCLNTLYVMTKTGTTVNSLADLEGKTVYTIQNGTPAIILRHLLSKSGVNATVKTSIPTDNGEKTLTTPADLQTYLTLGEIDIALVPEPVATAAPLQIASAGKEYNYTTAINLTDAWSKISDSPVAMGCIVTTKSFAEENKKRVDDFLSEYKASIEYISNPENLDAAAQLVVDARVLKAVPAAKKSLKNLGSAISYVDGDEMKSTLTDFYGRIGVKPIGGKLPEDDFYYKK